MMKGEIVDFANNETLDNVNIKNIYTSKGMTTSANGLFTVEIKKGELVEFSKIGYQTIRIRINSVTEPAYYKLVLKKVPYELREVDIRGKPLDFKKDSIRYRQVYDVVLRKEKRNEISMQNMPLAMLSKKNREEWAFQDMYAKWEQEKYIDFVFNDRLIHKITYLENEDLVSFQKKYRPSYTFLQTASEYEYLDYIKHCYYLFMHAKKATE